MLRVAGLALGGLVLANVLFVIAIETTRRLVAARRRWNGQQPFALDYPVRPDHRTRSGSGDPPVESPSRR